MDNKKTRESNIELLRIVAFLGVMIIHYNYFGGMKYSYGSIPNRVVLTYLESLFICAVDLFILLSGFFLYNSYKRNVWKIIDLFSMRIAFGVAWVLALVLFYKYSGKNLEIGMVKIIIPNDYFLVFYSVIYLISPFINYLLRLLDENNRKRLIIMMFLVFSVYPTFVDLVNDVLDYFSMPQIFDISSISRLGSEEGYTIVQFFLMYLVGAYLASKNNKETTLKSLIVLAGSSIGIFIWQSVENITEWAPSTSLSYCNPLVIIEAVAFFNLFRNIKLRDCKIINTLAKAGFMAYIFHCRVMGKIVNKQIASGNVFFHLAYLLIAIIAVYLFSFILYSFWALFTRLFNKIKQKIKLEYNL